jgi:HlyD family secretion protein
VVVDSNVKKVQHPTGGVVGEIRVRDGDRVKAGDLVVRLDETVTRANLAVVTKGLDELAARQDRLEAERDGRTAINVHANLKARVADPEIARLVVGEQRLFELRREAREGLRLQLKERIEQLKEQIEGLKLQATAKADEIKLIQDELVGVQDLWRKNLVPITRVTALRREETRLTGDRGQMISAIAQARGKISETELQIIQIDQDLRSEVAKELREVQAKSAELVERKVAAEDQLKRIDIRAPQAGIVHQLNVHTVGGVIAAGDLLMLVVPEADDLAIEVKVSPQDIDQLKIGQKAVLRLSAFNQRTTPEVNGEVKRIAADLLQDQTTGQSYYTARITMPDHEMTRLHGLKLLPGMPVEAFIQTGDRTALSYLMKPLSDQLVRAWRED